MDERRNNDGNNPNRPSRNYDSYYSGRNEKVNSFKLNIKDFDCEPEKYVPAEPETRKQQPRPISQNKTVKRQTDQQRAPKPTSAKRTAESAASRQTHAAKPVSSGRVSKSQNSISQGKPSANRQGAKRPTNSKPDNDARKARSQSKKTQRKGRLAKGGLIACVCIVSIAILTTILSTVALSTINDILAINKDESVTVPVVIPENADFDQVYDILCDNGLVKQKFITKLFCKFRHYDEYYSEKQQKYIKVEYQQGVQYFDTGMGIETMLENIKGSNSTSKDQITLTFPEGWTIAQIFEKLEKYKVCEANKLYSNLDIIGKQFDFYNEIKSNSGRYLKAEGYLFPDTYDFFIGENAISVLKKLFSNYQKKWTGAYSKQAKALGMTQDEIITLASIIQREAKDTTQMAVISSVLHNRLNNSATYPQLQMNSTKEYVTAVNKYGLFSEFYYSIYLESYNTYSCEGLPPGPICNPGIDAIYAALYPDDTDYYFFCHDNNGKIYLASTAAEHQANTASIILD